MLLIKRIYEQPSVEDGRRILVDRLWPRGIAKEEACLAEWMKAVAPSTALRKSFNHQPERFEEFTALYYEELNREEVQAELDKLCEMIASGPVTLLYAAKDAEHNHALVLMRFLEERMGRGKGG